MEYFHKSRWGEWLLVHDIRGAYWFERNRLNIVRITHYRKVSRFRITQRIVPCYLLKNSELEGVDAIDFPVSLQIIIDVYSSV